MALSKSVVKKSVVKDGTDNTITFTLTITDTEGPGFTKDYSMIKSNGEGVMHNVPPVKVAMQKDINLYKAEQVLFKATALDDAVTNISESLNL